ncbi:MAG: hypothetical protein Q9212_006438 [Teloschistes hypoglaucus]
MTNPGGGGGGESRRNKKTRRAERLRCKRCGSGWHGESACRPPCPRCQKWHLQSEACKDLAAAAQKQTPAVATPRSASVVPAAGRGHSNPAAGPANKASQAARSSRVTKPVVTIPGTHAAKNQKSRDRDERLAREAAYGVLPANIKAMMSQGDIDRLLNGRRPRGTKTHSGPGAEPSATNNDGCVTAAPINFTSPTGVTSASPVAFPGVTSAPENDGRATSRSNVSETSVKSTDMVSQLWFCFSDPNLWTCFSDPNPGATPPVSHKGRGEFNFWATAHEQNQPKGSGNWRSNEASEEEPVPWARGRRDKSRSRDESVGWRDAGRGGGRGRVPRRGGRWGKDRLR